MVAAEVIRSWGRILAGYRPELAIEVTRQCPLRCPGCYAYSPNHQAAAAVSTVADLTGDALVNGVLDVVRVHRPLHVTLIGGEPLVRYRELDVLLPRLVGDGIHVQVVTSAVRPIPVSWRSLSLLNLSVSVDGLPAEHDARRTPATYDRILQHIDGHCVTVHCTVTHQLMQREGYLEEFVRFWSEQACAKRIWVSLYTPQVGEVSDECLGDEERRRAVAELAALRTRYEKLDMGPLVLGQLLEPPRRPGDCYLARLATCVSPDLRTEVTPCQIGGNPDCSRCGCMAAAGVGAITKYKLFGIIPLRVLVEASQVVGGMARRIRAFSAEHAEGNVPQKAQKLAE
jgi:MoaA/NifB/PqqE/SkfB family radical SAM enzyme